ncbi:MAG: hypothetical protein J5569_07425 [Oscillospiraceae bacterium]|nr:hypothetical protein [Oscillospiraceae bacterium]
MSIPMAIVDFVPVVLFLAAAVILQRWVYPRASKGAFALFSAGTIMIVCAGIMKAVWKLLYAAGVCDFERLNQSFFPMQAIGFLLAGIAIAALIIFPQGKKAEALYAAAVPAVFPGTMIFVVLMVLGSLGLCGGLALTAARQKKKTAAILFGVAFVLMLAMGYLSSRDFTKPVLNWIAEIVNVLGEGALLVASVMLVQKQKETPAPQEPQEVQYEGSYNQ